MQLDEQRAAALAEVVDGLDARAQALTEEERKEIAAKGAAARWGIPKATHRGELVIGATSIPCAVLEDGRRVLTENGITNAILGSRIGASKRLKKAATPLGLVKPIHVYCDKAAIA